MDQQSTQVVPLWMHDIIVVTAGKKASLCIDQQSTQWVALWKHDYIVVMAGKKGFLIYGPIKYTMSGTVEA